MAFLQGSSNIVIQDGQFTNIQGCQHITHVHGNCGYQEGKRLTEDFKRIRTGDIYLINIIDSADVAKPGDTTWKGVVARRVLSVAHVSGEDKDTKFTYVYYDGQDAFKAFKRDFAQFSRVKHPNIIQLFGYNDLEIPALIFHDELIPLHRIIFDKNQLHPVLYTYFQYQFGMTWQKADVAIDMGELWVEPRTGALRRGMSTQIPRYDYWFFTGLRSRSPTGDYFSPLSIQTYRDTNAVLHFLCGNLPTHCILQGIGWSGHTYRKKIKKEDLHMLRSLPGTVFHRHKKSAIARWSGVGGNWSYRLKRVVGNIPDGIKRGQIMKGGLARFVMTPADAQHVKRMTLHYSTSRGNEWDMFMESWLAQAHSLFTRLHIPNDTWHRYGVQGSVWFDLHFLCGEEHTCLQGNSNTIGFDPSPVYLFIRPIPHPLDDETIWTSWIEGPKYFWSSLPNGDEEMSSATQESLRLPSVTFNIWSQGHYWNHSHYKLVWELHHRNGFDPSTTGLLHSLTRPYFELIGDDDSQTTETSGADGKHMPIIFPVVMLVIWELVSYLVHSVKSEERDVQDGVKDEADLAENKQESTSEAQALRLRGGIRIITRQAGDATIRNLGAGHAYDSSYEAASGLQKSSISH
ncbi:hypothetical protein WG66_001600 [Moniliophthora roreri]|nr:hypothetical protein WG66_001600 [Moniliophthora roreri]